MTTFNIEMPSTPPSRRLTAQVKASALSCAMLALALAVLWFGNAMPSGRSDMLEVREISLAALPPPPPPPPMSVTTPAQAETPIQLQTQGAGPAIAMADIRPQVDLKKPETLQINRQSIQWQPLEIDWKALDLSELDGAPTLLTPLRVNFPKSLSRKGVHQVLVKLDIVIDEQGKVTLIKIAENPYPELIGEIQALVRQTRFSPPQKNHQPARARFIWPVNISS